MLAHRVQELSDKLDREQKDFEYRLCAMAAQQLGATPGQGGQSSENGLPCSPGGPSQASAPPPMASAAPTMGPGKPPGTLGTLSQHDALPLGPPPAQETPTQFDAAMNLLSKAQYDEARASFRSFADASPKDARAPQAVYWIGRIAYVQKDYPGAARAFAEEVKKYPTSADAPESMIKLGESMIAMGQKKEGCIALAALRSKYPTAPKSLFAKASATRKSFCR
jgi:tol-pal system protein YbgF